TFQSLSGDASLTIRFAEFARLVPPQTRRLRYAGHLAAPRLLPWSDKHREQFQTGTAPGQPAPGAYQSAARLPRASSWNCSARDHPPPVAATTLALQRRTGVIAATPPEIPCLGLDTYHSYHTSARNAFLCQVRLHGSLVQPTGPSATVACGGGGWARRELNHTSTKAWWESRSTATRVAIALTPPMTKVG
nr:hypothetical protein [Tanacetum cinerariifolium]